MASEKSLRASAKVQLTKNALACLINIQATESTPLFDPNRHLVVDRSAPRPKNGVQQPHHNAGIEGFEKYFGMAKHAGSGEFLFVSDLKLIQGSAADQYTVSQCEVLSGTRLFGCCKMGMAAGNQQGQQCRHLTPDHSGIGAHAKGAAARHIFHPFVVWQVCLISCCCVRCFCELGWLIITQQS
jgi:hypothetical protein